MPQDGSNNYYYPPGTPGVPDQTIESEAYNTFLNDLVSNDLNIARPVHRGGTGATAADQGLVNLAGEKATQLVTNFDSHVWLPGSFRSTNAAGQAAPVDGHAFAGICYLNEPFVYPPTNQNLIVEARDESDTVIPGRVYVRQKKAGVWDAAWVEQVGGSADLLALADARYVDVAGDTMTGPLVLPGDATLALQAVPKQQLDVVSAVAAAAAPLDALAYSGMQINGSMEVSQELGIGGAVTVFNTAKYVLDGWQISSAGTQSVYANHNTSVPGGFKYCLNAYLGTGNPAPAAGDICTIEHRIEGYRIVRLGWGTAAALPITLSFWVSCPIAGIQSGAIRNAALNRSYVFTYTHGGIGWEYKTITIPGCTDGTWPTDNTQGLQITFSVICGSTYRTAANAWTTGNFVAVTGGANMATATSTGASVTGVTILPGTHAPTAAQSPLIMRPFDQELVMCERYFSKTYHYSTAIGSAAANFIGVHSFMATSPYGEVGSYRYPVRMRSAPTVTLYSPANGAPGHVYVGTGTNVAATAGNIADGGFGGYTVAFGSGNNVCVHIVADARL